MALSAVEQMTHEQILKEWVENLREEGYEVRSAALPEFVDKPRAVHGGPAPDLIAKDSQNRPAIGIVKTADDIDNEHTRQQLDNYCRVCALVMLLVRDRDLHKAVSTVEDCGGGTFEIWVAR